MLSFISKEFSDFFFYKAQSGTCFPGLLKDCLISVFSLVLVRTVRLHCGTLKNAFIHDQKCVAINTSFFEEVTTLLPWGGVGGFLIFLTFLFTFL
jgi:hypothetical protein